MTIKVTPSAVFGVPMTRFEVHTTSGDPLVLDLVERKAHLRFDEEEDRLELSVDSLETLLSVVESYGAPVRWTPGGMDLPVLEFVDVEEDEGDAS